MNNICVKIPVSSLYSMRHKIMDNISHSMALALCGDIECALKYSSMADFYNGQLSFVDKLIGIYKDSVGSDDNKLLDI